jgi:hypothetical protein
MEKVTDYKSTKHAQVEPRRPREPSKPKLSVPLFIQRLQQAITPGITDTPATPSVFNNIGENQSTEAEEQTETTPRLIYTDDEVTMLYLQLLATAIVEFCVAEGGVS